MMTSTITNRMKLALAPALTAALALAAGSPSPARADDVVVDLGGDDQPQRRCPNLTVKPEDHYERFMEVARSVGKANIPYFSCRPDCKLFERSVAKKPPPLSESEAARAQPHATRNKRLWSLLGKPHANTVFYGKASAAGYQALADKLSATGAQDDWNDLAGLDCNGFTYHYGVANGWSWITETTEPPAYAAKPHVQRTVDICPGDIIVYTGTRHVAIVGERVGQEVLNSFKDRQTGKTETVQLATFRVYESAADGTPTGLQEHVQGFDLNTTDKLRLFHYNQPDRTQWNWVVVVPGSGSL